MLLLPRLQVDYSSEEDAHSVSPFWPDTSSIVLEWQSQSKANHDKKSCLYEFWPGQEVIVVDPHGFQG